MDNGYLRSKARELRSQGLSDSVAYATLKLYNREQLYPASKEFVLQVFAKEFDPRGTSSFLKPYRDWLSRVA